MQKEGIKKLEHFADVINSCLGGVCADAEMQQNSLMFQQPTLRKRQYMAITEIDTKFPPVGCFCMETSQSHDEQIMSF